MEIKQRAQSNRITYAFEDDRIRYAWQDSSGSRSFTVGYAEISRDRQTLVERNPWLRNAGLFWMALGLLLTAFGYYEQKSLVPSIWLLIGAGCYVAYRLRAVGFTIIPTEKGNLLVIQDADGERILREIEARRADYLRREYDFVPEGDGPEQLRKRYRWLHEEGALTEDELGKRLQRIDAVDPAVQLVNQILAANQTRPG